MSPDWVYDKTEESSEEEESPELKYEILNYPADTTLRGYLDQWTTEQLVVPPFQRQFVWDQVKASKLIESFLIGLPVPGVFLYKERSQGQFLIVDGQQRITSVVFFQKGLFGEKKFRLKGVSPKWEGQTFTDLTDNEKFKLENSVMRATIIQQLSPKDNTSIYHIFERLNTGGVNLNPMEVRKCVSHGPFVEELQNVNKNSDWRSCVARNRPDKRLRDVELILRCYAVYDNYEKYEKPMKGFLNNYAEEMRNNEKHYGKLGDRFTTACAIALRDLGEKPFHLRGRLNYGVLDSMIVALMNFPKARNVAKKFEKLKRNAAYMESVTHNTSDASVLKSRIQTALAAFSN